MNLRRFFLELRFPRLRCSRLGHDWRPSKWHGFQWANGWNIVAYEVWATIHRCRRCGRCRRLAGDEVTERVALSALTLDSDKMNRLRREGVLEL